MLEVQGLSVAYDDVPVLRDISLQVAAGDVVAVVGANGAGKTTLLKTISGLLKPFAGSIRFDGRTTVGLGPHQVVSLGIAHVPEGRRLFGRLTVEENLLLGAYTRRDRAYRASALEQVYARFPRLRERRTQRAGTLSGGEQQMLAIGRGLMSRPRLLMLDEPSLGIAPNLAVEIFESIARMKDEGITVLLVEQNVVEALELADRGYVLQTGRIVLEGSGRELLESDLVRQAYLGMLA